MVQYNRDTSKMHRCNTDSKSKANVIDLEDKHAHHKESFTKQLRHAKKEHDSSVIRSSPALPAKMEYNEVILSVEGVVEAATDAINATLDQVNEQLRSSSPVEINQQPMRKAEKQYENAERKVQDFKQHHGEFSTRGNESY